MSSILKGLESKIEKQVAKRMTPIALKLDEMIKILKEIEKNTRGKK